MSVLSGLQPAEVFSYFEKLSAVPHGSGNTKIISDLCAGFARELGLKYRQDAADNLVIWKDASPGYEGAEPIILQGHLDMVCTKTEDCPRDMAAEGLELMTDGEWVWAKDTTLGGDDGIALAMILAILADPELPHPPIQALFTSDEEIGMVGAFALDCSDITGRKLINLDSEREGVFTVSCAGGVRLDCLLPGTQEAAGGLQGYTVTLNGLQGGHSGSCINKGRGSANQLMGRVLFSAMEQVPGLRLANIQGGRFENVICSETSALVAVPAEQAGPLEAFLDSFAGVLKSEYAAGDPGLSLTWEQTGASTALSAGDTGRVLSALLALPQGVETMSMDFPGVVQTSLNLGAVRTEADGLHLTFSVRSSVASQKAMLVQRVRAIVACAGGRVQERNNYPGWQFVRDSAFRELAMAAYRDVTGLEPVMAATHGGLECGRFIEKMPGLDALSVGPELLGAHSVQERLSVPSTQRIYSVLREILIRSKS